jgi:hypothetical protein
MQGAAEHWEGVRGASEAGSRTWDLFCG